MIISVSCPGVIKYDNLDEPWSDARGNTNGQCGSPAKYLYILPILLKATDVGLLLNSASRYVGYLMSHCVRLAANPMAPVWY